MEPLFGCLAALWLLGIAVFFWIGCVVAVKDRPWGLSWLVPLWPLMVAFELWQIRREKLRLARMKAEVWKR